MSISDMTLSMAVPLMAARRVDELELRQEILHVGEELLALSNKLFQLEGVSGRGVTGVASWRLQMLLPLPLLWVLYLLLW